MSDIIKINNLPGLSQYGKALTAYGDQIKGATEETMRQFITKTDESYSDAVLAFFEKLNTLQSKVFHDAPDLIRDYGNKVQFFEDSVRSIGFDVKAWTWEEGKVTVINKLKGEQVDEIKDVMNRLQPLLDQTSEKTSFPYINLVNRHLDTIQTNLESMANNRLGTHVSISAAHDLFNVNVLEIITKLENLISFIIHAKAMFTIPPTTVFNAIKSGLLTSETMGYLDDIENETDASALKSVLEKKPENLVKLDKDKISAGTYESIGGILETFVRQEDSVTINKLLDALGEKDRDYVLGFTNSLLEAEDRRATTLEGFMYSKAMAHPEMRTNGELKSKEKQLELMNRVTGLFNSVQELQIGKEKVKHYTTTDKDNYFWEYKKNKMSLSFEGGQEKLKVNSYGYFHADTSDVIHSNGDNQQYAFLETKEYYSHLVSGIHGVNAADYDLKLQEYQKERVKAHIKFVTDTLAAFADVGTGILGPQVYLINKAIQYGMSEDFVNSAKNVSKFSFGVYDNFNPNTIFKNPDKEWAKNTRSASVDLLSIVKAYYEKEKKLADIKTDEQEAARVQYYNILNHGEWQLNSVKRNANAGHTITRDRIHYHDVDALFRENELNQEGVLGFLNSDKAKLDLNETAKNKIDNLSVSSEMKAYLKGEEFKNHKLKLEDMTPEQINELDTAIGQLGSDSMDSLNAYFEEKYKFK